MINSRHFRGYSRPNAENTRNLPDFREQIDIGLELPALDRENLPLWANIQGSNQWPANWSEFQQVVIAWQEDYGRLPLSCYRLLCWHWGGLQMPS